MWEIAIAGCFAGVIVLVPLVGRLAWKIGAVDVPHDWRRMHTDSVPRAGGIAIMTVVAAGWLLFCPHTLAGAAGLAGGLAVFCIGLADDIQPLPAGIRLGVQLIAAIVATVGAGVRSLPAFFATAFWLIAMTNAHNLIDGLDGLFAGTATVEGIGIALVLFLGGNRGQVLPPLLISAACLGFLRYNRPPATIFAGDCGSGAVGFLLGVTALPAWETPAWGLGVLAPLFVFAYPLTDMTAAVIRRILHGKSPFAADRAHLHHRICAIGIPVPVCSILLVSVTFVLCLFGVLLADPAYARIASAAAVGAVLFLMMVKYGLTRFFKVHEKKPETEKISDQGCKDRKNMV